MATGAWPAQHGIVADSWYDADEERRVEASDEQLAATTLLAQVAAEPRARVAVIASDESKGMLFTGTPDARLFAMDEQGLWTTRGDSPDWLTAFNEQRLPQSLRDARWLAVGAPPDAPPLRTLTYSPGREKEFLSLYKASPFAQNAQFDLAAEYIARETPGDGSTLDLVCILAGATELIGYETGARSPLLQQMVLHLDRRLETLLAQLSKAPGDGNFALALAGAHGAAPEPPPDHRPRMAVTGEDVAQTVDRLLRAESLGKVSRYLYPFLYLDTSEFRDPEPVRRVAARSALDHPAVAGYFTAGGACSTHTQWSQRFRNSFHAKRSGDVMLSYLPEYVEDYGQGRGISYGSLYNYDARVPLCLFGPQFRAGVYESPVESVDVAPTLARALGVAAPSSSTGRVLAEAFLE